MFGEGFQARQWGCIWGIVACRQPGPATSFGMSFLRDIRPLKQRVTLEQVNTSPCECPGEGKRTLKPAEGERGTFGDLSLVKSPPGQHGLLHSWTSTLGT